MKYPKRKQYKYAKSRYRVRNWPQYEAGLRRRGDVTVWFSEDAIEAWRAPADARPGGQRKYADIAIEAALTIRMVFHLPLRQTEGGGSLWGDAHGSAEHLRTPLGQMRHSPHACLDSSYEPPGMRNGRCSLSEGAESGNKSGS